MHNIPVCAGGSFSPSRTSSLPLRPRSAPWETPPTPPQHTVQNPPCQRNTPTPWPTRSPGSPTCPANHPVTSPDWGPLNACLIKTVQEAKAADGKKNSLDPRKLFDSLSVACQQEDEVAKRLQPSPGAQEEAESPGDLPLPDSDRPPPPLVVPDLSRHTTKRKKSKHKHRDKTSAAGLDKEKKRSRAAKERRKDHSSDDPSKVLLDGSGQCCKLLLCDLKCQCVSILKIVWHSFFLLSFRTKWNYVRLSWASSGPWLSRLFIVSVFLLVDVTQHDSTSGTFLQRSGNFGGAQFVKDLLTNKEITTLHACTKSK